MHIFISICRVTNENFTLGHYNVNMLGNMNFQVIIFYIDNINDQISQTIKAIVQNTVPVVTVTAQDLEMDKLVIEICSKIGCINQWPSQIQNCDLIFGYCNYRDGQHVDYGALVAIFPDRPYNHFLFAVSHHSNAYEQTLNLNTHTKKAISEFRTLNDRLPEKILFVGNGDRAFYEHELGHLKTYCKNCAFVTAETTSMTVLHNSMFEDVESMINDMCIYVSKVECAHSKSKPNVNRLKINSFILLYIFISIHFRTTPQSCLQCAATPKSWLNTPWKIIGIYLSP